jgi:hypothetical protein
VYSLCAVLGRASDLDDRLAAGPHPPLVSLAGDLAMVPLTEAWLQHLQRTSATPEGRGGVAAEPSLFEFLTATVDLWIRALSIGTAVAYVETEYFAGEGFERAAVWRDGAPVLGPLDGAGAINRALRFLGVVAEAGREEFDVVGLGRHRNLEEWTHEARPRPGGGGALNSSV